MNQHRQFQADSRKLTVKRQYLVARLEKHRFLEIRCVEVEATRTEEFLRRGDCHDFEDVMMMRQFDAGIDERLADAQALCIFRDGQRADLGQLARVNLQRRAADDLPVHLSDERRAQPL